MFQLIKVFGSIIMFQMFSGLCTAQSNLEFIKNSDLITLYIDSVVYSETTTAIKLKNGNLMVGGFYRKDEDTRLSGILLFNSMGQRLENGYDTDFLSYFLYEDKENFVVDLANAVGGGAYVLGTAAKSNYYTGYLAKLSSDAKIDEHFSVPLSEDTGFVNIHNYKIVKPNTNNQFQELNDTTYSEPKKILIQSDGKILVVAVTRKQTSENNYKDGESYVMRLFPNGTLDSSFGVDGVAHVNFSDACDDVTTALLDDKDQIILFGKYNHDYKLADTKGVHEIYVTRLSKNGQLDNNFGKNGVFIFSYPGSELRPVKILPSSNHSLLFFSNIEIKKGAENYNYGLNIFKLNVQGKLDETFQEQGVINIYRMGIAFTNDVQLTPDNKILLCGTNQNLLKDQLDDNEILFSSNPNDIKRRVYTEEELNKEVAIGFAMRLDAECNIDSTFPKNGLHFTDYSDKTIRLFFSNLLVIDANQFVIFGSGATEEKRDSVGFVVQRIVTKLNLGEIVCKKDLGLSFYPNPIKEFANIEFDLCEAEQLSAYLYNMNGQLVQTFFENKNLEKGHHKEQLQFNLVKTSGTYILQLHGKNVSKSIKVIKE